MDTRFSARESMTFLFCNFSSSSLMTSRFLTSNESCHCSPDLMSKRGSSTALESAGLSSRRAKRHARFDTISYDQALSGCMRDGTIG